MASYPIKHLQSVASVPKPEPQEPLNLAPIEHGKFTFSTSGLTVHGDPSYEEWEEVGHMLAVMVRGLQFAVGDWLAIGESRFDELAAQVIDAREWSDSTVRVYRSISKRVPMENRRINQGLSYGHHVAVAALPVAQQRKWLDKAVGDGDDKPWTVNRLTIAIDEGADIEVTGWCIFVTASSERHRAKLVKMLELEGGAVKLIDKRERKGEK